MTLAFASPLRVSSKEELDRFSIETAAAGVLIAGDQQADVHRRRCTGVAGRVDPYAAIEHIGRDFGGACIIDCGRGRRNV